MGLSHQTIEFQADRCNGCNECVTACSLQKTGRVDPVHSRIQVAREGTEGPFGLALCRQCADPACVTDCPSGALSQDQETGWTTWDESKCIYCLICTMSCIYAGIRNNSETGQVMKCDMCGGAPACVKACEAEALKLTPASELYRTWGELEDLFVPGISACLGCNSELLMRHTLRRLGPDTVVATPPGCIAGVGAVGVNGRTSTKTPVFHPLLTNTAAMLAGIRRYYNRIGREVTMLAFGGDGGTADVGFQSLSGAAERGEQMIYICLDNEGYMNTGVQRSSTTPYGAWTSTTPVGTELRGKNRDAKPMPLLMVMHSCEYVATASTAFMQDYYAKLDKALEASKHGLAYIHVFSPCPTGWRFPPSELIEVGRKAVQTNFFPLWEFELGDQLRFTNSVENPLPVDDFLSLIGKYRHLDEEQKCRIRQKTAEKIRLLQRFAAGEQPDPRVLAA
ncbi:MAG: NADH-dependent phenylglyoxylate dehydrogenase subunit beta [Thermodesulfobacteriota bacterium]